MHGGLALSCAPLRYVALKVSLCGSFSQYHLLMISAFTACCRSVEPGLMALAEDIPHVSRGGTNSWWLDLT